MYHNWRWFIIVVWRRSLFAFYVCIKLKPTMPFFLCFPPCLLIAPIHIHTRLRVTKKLREICIPCLGEWCDPVHKKKSGCWCRSLRCMHSISSEKKARGVYSMRNGSECHNCISFNLFFDQLETRSCFLVTEWGENPKWRTDRVRNEHLKSVRSSVRPSGTSYRFSPSMHCIASVEEK